MNERTSILNAIPELDITTVAQQRTPITSRDAEKAKRASEEIAKDTGFQSREAKSTKTALSTTPSAKAKTAVATKPKKQRRRRRTGRTVQLNVKLRQDTIDDFYAVADKHDWTLGEAMERAVSLLKKDKG